MAQYQDALGRQARRSLLFLASLPRKKKIPFKQLYPFANPDAVALLERMLVFDADARILRAVLG